MRGDRFLDIISISHYFYPRPGGLEHMSYNMLREFSKRGFRTATIFAGNKNSQYDLSGIFCIETKQKEIFNCTYPIFDLAYTKRLWNLVKENPHAKILIHSHHLLSSLIGSLICRVQNRPYTLIQHTSAPSVMKNKLVEAIVNLFDTVVFGSVIFNAANIIAVSEEAKRYTLSKNIFINEGKVSVVANGFDNESVQTFTTDKKKNEVIYASRWIEVKNPQLVLNTFYKLAKLYPNWVFRFISENIPAGMLRKSTPTNLIIEHKLPLQKDLFDKLSKSKIYINASQSEGLALLNLEATALKNIPILSDAPSNILVAENLGSNKFVFKRNNRSELINKLTKAIKLSDDERKALTADFANNAALKYSNSQMVDSYENSLGLPSIINSAKYKKVSIIVPFHNEQRTLHAIHKKLLAVETFGLKKEIIYVNDASTDNSEKSLSDAIAKNTLDKNTKIITFENQSNLGKSQTVKKGILNSTGDLVVTQDADIEYEPSELSAFIKAFLTDAQLKVVYGNRYLYKQQKGMLSYYLGNKALTAFSNLFTKYRNFVVSDMEVCYKMMDGTLARSLAKEIVSTTNFGIEPEMTQKISAEITPNQYLEVPITYQPRTHKEGKHMQGYKHGLETIVDIIRFSNIFKNFVKIFKSETN